MTTSVRATRKWFALVLSFVFMLALLSQPFGQTPTVQAQSSPPRTVFVHLFEWKWSDIARECETFLGPRGFAGVQVSPPQEHAWFNQNGNYPWWLRYQAVSYQIASRSGTRAQFADMVQRCRAVGVDIYVDAIVNHMTGVGSGTGYAGSTFTPYTYPGTYASWDFNNCGRNGNNDIVNYSDRYEVQNCELVNLADLKTDSTYVRDRLGTYLNDLRSLGVAGFRIDAAKHMPAGDVQAIVSRITGTPYIYQEVIEAASEPIRASEYFSSGDVTEFKYSTEISRVFLSGQLSWLSNFGEPWGFMPNDKAVVFTDNHDNQRGHGGGGTIITHKNGKLYELANIFMLAWPYGYTQVMSSFNFTYGDQGPPADANGNTKSVYVNGTPQCGTEWICEHRWRGIANMVAFRNHTNASLNVTNWWTNGNNQIAFGRGDRGFVVINREGSALNRTFQTNMPAGTYCDVIAGDWNGSTCSGRTITVNNAGQATISVGANDAAAIHVGARVSGGALVATTFTVNATTNWGQSVYVVGNVPSLGQWNTANAILLSSATYPNWRSVINLPASTSIEYKYIKKDGAGNVVWESGSNRVFTTPASGTTTRTDTWR